MTNEFLKKVNSEIDKKLPGAFQRGLLAGASIVVIMLLGAILEEPLKKIFSGFHSYISCLVAVIMVAPLCYLRWRTKDYSTFISGELVGVILGFMTVIFAFILLGFLFLIILSTLNMFK